MAPDYANTDPSQTGYVSYTATNGNTRVYLCATPDGCSIIPLTAKERAIEEIKFQPFF